MVHTNTRWFITVILATFLAPLADAMADSTGNQIADAWRQRAQVAAKKLTEPGLDACDRGLELAFQYPKEFMTSAWHRYGLAVQISNQTLYASYTYNSRGLASFELVSLPPGWIARQRVDSKTLSILVGAANCALDFCTNNPFASGACPGDKPE